MTHGSRASWRSRSRAEAGTRSGWDARDPCVDRGHRILGPGRVCDHLRLVCGRGADYTRDDRGLPVQRATCRGSGPARPDHRLVAPGQRPGAGGAARSSHMRIYEGSPRQDFEEVFRSIGAFLDERGMRDILLLEVPDGFVVQGLVMAGGSTSAWSEAIGTQSKETLTFVDDDIAKFMEEAATRRGDAEPAAADERGPRACPARDRTLDRRAEAEGRVPVRAGRGLRGPAPDRPARPAPTTSWPSSPATTSSSPGRPRARRLVQARSDARARPRLVTAGPTPGTINGDTS